MKRRCFVVLVLCAGFFTAGTPASADIIIDENFDAAVRINSPVFEVIVTSMGMGMTAGMWWGGAPSLNMAWGVNMIGMDGMAMFPAMTGVPMMGMMGWWSSLTFFAAQPAAGWGASPLDLSFEFDLNAFGVPNGLDVLSPSTIGSFGAFGWPEGAPIFLEGPDPGFAGVELISGILTPTVPLAVTLDVAGGTYDGDLSRFDYIGVVFTIGDPEMPFPEGESLSIDNVLLRTEPSTTIIPEPATIGLAAIAVAAAAHRLRRRKRT